MPRLIDADALVSWLDTVPLENGLIDPDKIKQYISEMPDANGGWISVKDRLPKDCEPVIVYMERDAWDRKGKFRRKKDIEKGWQIDGVWHVDGCSRVLGLYWMPLPEPPNEGEVG